MSVSLYGSGGTILQVVNFSTITNVSTTSNSYVSTGIAATITPFATTSKILVLARFQGYDTNSAQGCNYTMYRGSTNLGNASFGFEVIYSTGAGQLAMPIVMNCLDSPATTSATTYTVYMLSGGGQSVQAQAYNCPGTIILLEISGA
jgi:hypothetical protein